jgi:16S rRNA processing protein RimM
VVLPSGETSWIPESGAKFDLICLLADASLQNLKSYKVLTIKKQAAAGLILVRLEGVSDREQAESLRGASFLIPICLISSQKGESLFLHELEGFNVFDKGKSVGTVVGFSSNGPQDLLLIAESGSEKSCPTHPPAEVPLVDAFLKEIKFESKAIFMELPEGLLEINRRRGS